MKLLLSRIYATLLAIWYGGYITYSHINNEGYWEFRIYFDYGFNYRKLLYKTKGLR